MEEKEDVLRRQEINMRGIEEKLMDVLSLVILLENDMEAQRSDNVHIRVIKKIHSDIKSIQKNLSEVNCQTE